MHNVVPPLEIHDLTVAYHRNPVLWGIDLQVPAGKLIGIVGPNGAGKSTLIKAIMGLVPVSSGWIKIFGQPFKKALRRSPDFEPVRRPATASLPRPRPRPGERSLLHG